MQQSPENPILKIDNVIVECHKAKVFNVRSEYNSDWHEVKTLSGKTKLISIGTSSEIFGLRIEWVDIVSSNIYQDLVGKLITLCRGNSTFSIVLPDGSIKTRCALIHIEEDVIHNKEGKVRKSSIGLRFKREIN